MSVNIKKLNSLTKKHGVTYCIKLNGHVQIKGGLLINYYPLSKNKTAYIAQTNKGFAGISYNEAVKLSITVPKSQGHNSKRKGNYKKEKRKMLKRSQRCKWCEKPLSMVNATLDHKVPLSLGGLNNYNNYVLACHECNQKRSNKMPEIASED